MTAKWLDHLWDSRAIGVRQKPGTVGLMGCRFAVQWMARLRGLTGGVSPVVDGELVWMGPT